MTAPGIGRGLSQPRRKVLGTGKCGQRAADRMPLREHRCLRSKRRLRDADLVPARPTVSRAAPEVSIFRAARAKDCNRLRIHLFAEASASGGRTRD